MRIVYLLLHDFRFASLGLRDFVRRSHFSKEYAKRMAALGHDVKLYVFGAHGLKPEVVRADGYELKGFRSLLKFPPLMKFGNDHSAEVLAELQRDAPDIVHIHNYYLWNFPYVATWAKSRSARVIAQFHGTDPIRRLKAFAFYPSLRLCDLLLVPTMSEEAFLTSRLGIVKRRVVRFPSTGVDTGKFHPTGAQSEGPVFAYVGRIPKPASYLWEKSPLYLLPIMKVLHDRGIRARLTVAGDGPGLKAMRDAAENSALGGSMDFLGQVGQDVLPDLYSQSKLTFDPIYMDDIEPFWGGTVQESLACGTPVAAFNNQRPGLRKYGVLTPTSAEKAADAVLMALTGWEQSPASREGRDFVTRYCGWEPLIARLNQIYEGVVR